MPAFLAQLSSSVATLRIGGAQVLLVLAAQVALGVTFGYLAWQNWRRSELVPFRNIAGAAVALVGLAVIRLIEVEIGASTSNAIVAAHSLADLALVAAVLTGARRLVAAGVLSDAQVVLMGLACFASLFWGLMDSDGSQPLLVANAPAAVFYLGFFGLLCYYLQRALVGRYADENLRLREDLVQAREENETVSQEAAEATEAAGVTGRLLAAQKEDAGQLMQRARALEQILAVSAGLHAAGNLNELFDQVVHAVRDILGFNMVLLRIYSRSTQAFEARAFAGIPEDGRAHLAAIQVTSEEYSLMADSRFRISDSYFISHKMEGSAAATEGAYVPDLGARGEDDWSEEDALIIPLVSTTGETRGYLSVDDPRDRRLPTLGTIRQLEFLARQATAAYESTEVCDRLAHNNAELAQASEKARNLSDMKNNFVANVSHELRTPLTSIRAYTEILQQGTSDMAEDVRLEFLKVIQNESEKLSRIIDDILDLSQMENKGNQLDRSETDLAALLRRAAEKSADVAAEAGIEFSIDVRPEEIPLNIDPMLWQQLLDHLVGNALKFTPSGGRITIRLRDEQRVVRLEVSDTGIGIPEEKMPYIFDRFYQVDGSSTREHGGQGVGLALCQDIVDFHDGRIWAENRGDGGARFCVLLPRRQRVIQRISTDNAVLAADQPERFLERLVGWIAEIVGVQMVSVLVPDASGQQMMILVALGLPESVVQSTRIRRGAGIVGKVWASGRTLHVEDITGDGRFDKTRNSPQYSTPSFLSVPLLDGMDVLGVVNVNNRIDGRALTVDDRLLVESLAPRLSYLLREYFDFRGRGGGFAQLQNVLRISTFAGLDEHDALRAVCHETVLATARSIRLPEQELEHLAFALKYYDVGLARIPDRILRKSEPLTEEERERVQRHVEFGLETLAPLQPPAKVRQIILHHHERHDGQGYPEGLDGEAIPLGSRLVALADSLSAMLHRRPWRASLTPSAALEQIESLSGTQYCPRLTPVFLAEARARLDELVDLQLEIPVHTTQADGPTADTPAGVH